MVNLIGVVNDTILREGYKILKFDSPIKIEEASRIICEGFSNFLKGKKIDGKVSFHQTIFNKNKPYYGIFVEGQRDTNPFYEIIGKKGKDNEFLFYPYLNSSQCISEDRNFLGFNPEIMLDKN